MAMNYSFLAATSVKTGVPSVVRLVAYLALAVFLGACSPQATEQELLDRARDALEQGEARAAEIDVKTALQQSPDNPSARRLLGEVYLFQQNPVAAVEEFERALATSENEETRVLYARALLAAGSGERLLELAEQDDFASVADNPRYLATLARARADGGDLQQASDSMDAALAAAPGDPYVSTTNAFFQLAYSGALEEAQASLQGIVESHPEYVDAWSLLGGIQQMNGELAEAETSYVRAAELNPYRLVDRLNLVTVRIEQGKTEEAETILQRLLSSNPDHPGVNFLEGRMLLESGDNAGALAAFRNVFSVSPDHPGSLYLAALANIGEGNLATAQSRLESLLAEQPDNRRGRLLLSNLNLLMDDPEAAEEVARGILQEDEMDYSAMGLLAAALNAQGQQGSENTELYQRMATARPDAAEPRLAMGAALLQNNDIAGARTHFERALELDPDNRTGLFSLARLMLQEGRGAEAVQLLEDARDDHPREPALWLLLAEARLRVGDVPAAAEAGEQLVELLPDDPTAQSAMAQIELRRGQFGEAEEHLRQSLSAQPENADLQKLLVNALVGQGKLEDAGTMLEGMPEDVANEPAVLVARGRIALARNEPGEAESHLRSAMDEDPASMTLLWLSGAIQSQGRDDEAVELLDDWLADHPDDLQVRNQLASAYLQLGREREAREQYQALVERAPDSVPVLNNLAWLLRENDPQQALAHIEKADELAPDNPQIMDTYAMVQLERGARGEALSLSQRALDQAPDNPELLYHRAMILQADGQREEAVRILEELVEAEDLAQREEVQALLAELQD